VPQKTYTHVSKCKNNNNNKKEKGKNETKKSSFQIIIVIQFGKKGYRPRIF
jgi:hypothetical protein